jgi:hypothetical protein
MLPSCFSILFQRKTLTEKLMKLYSMATIPMSLILKRAAKAWIDGNIRAGERLPLVSGFLQKEAVNRSENQ